MISVFALVSITGMIVSLRFAKSLINCYLAARLACKGMLWIIMGNAVIFCCFKKVSLNGDFPEIPEEKEDGFNISFVLLICLIIILVGICYYFY